MEEKTESIPLQTMDSWLPPSEEFGCSMIFVGSTRSGKTTMLNYIFNRHFKNYIITLMSNSLNSDAYKYLKKLGVNSDFFHSEILKEQYQINHATKNHYKFMNILDDIPDKRNNNELKRMLTIYRNSRISCAISVQGITMLDKTCRGNINYVFLGRMNSDAEIEKVVKEYLVSWFPKNLRFHEKIALYRKLTDDHHWIVLNQIDGIIFRTKLRPSEVYT